MRLDILSVMMVLAMMQSGYVAYVLNILIIIKKKLKREG